MTFPPPAAREVAILPCKAKKAVSAYFSFQVSRYGFFGFADGRVEGKRHVLPIMPSPSSFNRLC